MFDWLRKIVSGSEDSNFEPVGRPGPLDVDEATAAAEARRLALLAETILSETFCGQLAGRTTAALADELHDRCRQAEISPAMLGYGGFPAAAAISVNDELVHGVPSKRKLQDGDLVTFELGVSSNRGHGQSTWTVALGSRSPEDELLLSTGRQALLSAVAPLHAGNRIGNVSSAIQKTVEAADLTVVRDFIGYRIGLERIMEPALPGYGNPGRGPKLSLGHIFAVHVILKHGDFRTSVDENGWTARSIDGRRGAAFCAMVEVGETTGTLLSTTLVDIPMS